MPARCQLPHVCHSLKVTKVIQIQNLWFGTLRQLLLMGALCYICFALVTDKLYQKKESVISSVHTKVKGLAEVKEEILGNREKKVVSTVFDPADYAFPLQGNSFFVMTNFLKTKGQQRGVCPEYPTPKTLCHSDKNCKQGWMDPQSKGIQTGRCVVYAGNQKTCEVYAWCPTEATAKVPRPALLNSAENFTVFIKNNIDFPGHNYTMRNILPDFNKTCTFHKTKNPQCPIFRLGDIFQETGDNFSEVAIQGGIMGIEIYWDCNLDSWSYHCRPQYRFRRLDDKITNESLYPGYNFRHAKYYMENGVEKRTLIKVFGIRFDILVFGTGGKFHIISLIVSIGSTLSYFGLATVFIDFLIHTYSSACCRSCVYRYCECCEGCLISEYYDRKKCEVIVEPKRTLKYVSFVDEAHIRMVNEQLHGRSLQDVKGKKVPRPLMDFREVSRLPLSLPDAHPNPEQPEQMQLLREVKTPRSSSPAWCRCGNCLPSQLPKDRQCMEELCCRKEPGPCITTSELFKELVLSRRALQFSLLYQEPLLTLDADATDSLLRHCAYKCYATWRFGSPELVDFAILPSCCRWRIRKEFPKSEGQYSGFKSPLLME